jgi:ATP-binding protein involved in chromosome partitioning
MKNINIEQQIVNALGSFSGAQGQTIYKDMIESFTVDDQGGVNLILKVDPSQGASLEPFRQSVESFILSLPSVSHAQVILTAEKTKASGVPDPHGMAKNPPLSLPIRHIIAVASGKGGVGKSTVAFNLARALAAMGKSVGLLDADIYGPSVAKLSGLLQKKPALNEVGKLIPPIAHGMKVMSMGFLVEEEKAMIWRGPMVQTAFYQLLRDVDWADGDSPLDILIIDMPPGTGDVQLTLAQKVQVTGAVIVSTPQDLALIDARKAITMFEKTNVRILGLVENMSVYCCPKCGYEDAIFGHGGAKDEAAKRGVPFLGEIPLNGQIRADSDSGIGASHPAYRDIAHATLNALGAMSKKLVKNQS